MEISEVINKSQRSDGRLVEKFQHASNLTIEKYLCYIKYSLFKEKYHQIHKRAQQKLKRIHHHLLIQLKSKMRVQALTLYRECNISSLLHTFEKITLWIQENKSDEIEWEKKGTSNNVVKNHFFNKKNYKDRLEHQLENLSFENDAMEKDMFDNHLEILELKECIVDLNKIVCWLLDDLNDTLNPKVEELSDEISSLDLGSDTND